MVVSTRNILLCADLDRTIVPNGPEPESPVARRLLRRVVSRNEVTFAFVSGRHLELMEEAIRAYELPCPDFAIGDVGTTIYELQRDRWTLWEAWQQTIGSDWNGLEHGDLARLLDDLPGLRFQEPEKQGRFKLSYYVEPGVDAGQLLTEARSRLKKRGVNANLVWSIDDLTQFGLLDIIPFRASKLAAIRFLIRAEGFREGNVVFAGDSGNDLSVLTSGLQSVLVRNARPAVRSEALARTRERPQALYCATGGFLEMNGNYAAGVLEGLAHFVPETLEWMGE